MEQSPRFVSQGEYGKACHLQKSIYGLKQSPRVRFGRYGSVLQEFGLHCSQKDHLIFFRIHQGKRILLVVYMDDIVITRDDIQGISDLKLYLQQSFKSKI